MTHKAQKIEAGVYEYRGFILRRLTGPPTPLWRIIYKKSMVVAHTTGLKESKQWVDDNHG